MITAIKNQLNIHVRWMIRRDLDQVLKIEKENGQLASPVGEWSEEDFIAILGQSKNIGLVAVDEKDHAYVRGFCVYNVQEDRFHIFNMAVEKKYENRGIGAQIIAKLKNKCSPSRRRMLEIDVRESNLDAQLFLRKQDFLAVEIIHKWYEQPIQEDAYRFRYTVE